jgi:hypothetical protein
MVVGEVLHSTGVALYGGLEGSHHVMEVVVVGSLALGVGGALVRMLSCWALWISPALS